MPPILFPTRSYQLCFALLSAALLLTFYHRAYHFDEAWFAEQSFWLTRTGHVRSELFDGYIGWGDGLYVFHKLFIYAGAAVMYVTGFSVVANKLVSIGFSLLGGYLVWFYGKQMTREQQWLSVILYFGCGTLIRYAAVNRPETMCTALGFASFLFLYTPGVSARPKPIAAGVLAGLAALTHLNGLIYLITGALWLFLKAGWRATIVFSIFGFLTLSFYGLDALVAGKIPVLLNQFFHDPATQQNLNLSDKLSVLADYHQIFFHSQNEGALSALVILCAIAFRKKLSLLQPVLLYTVLLVLSFWLLTKSDTDMYFLLFVPWLAVLSAEWLLTYLPEQPHWQKRAARVLLYVYLAVGAYKVYEVLLENSLTPDAEQHNALLASYMPRKQTNVIAPFEFFFGQIDNYQIRGLTYYHLLERIGQKIPLSTFFRLAAQENVAYIISDYGKNASYEIPYDAPAQIGPYHRVFRDEWSSVYVRR